MGAFCHPCLRINEDTIQNTTRSVPAGCGYRFRDCYIRLLY